MPKIINDIEKKIFEAVIKIIQEKGYKGLNMKIVASEASIAVGTLYNYYSDKKDLASSVFYESWNDSIYKIKKCLKEVDDVEDRADKFICLIYKEFKKRRGVGFELIKNDVIDKNRHQKIKRELDSILKDIISDLEAERGINLGEDTKKRVVHTFFSILINLIIAYENEDEENIEFIRNALYRLLQK